MTPFWIAFEGGEGCGKTTQSAIFAERIGARRTREPGGTRVGESIRRLLLDPATGDIDARAEALLMAADRAQHIAEVVIPSLGAGSHVVSDRSAWSSLAYQGFGRGLALDGVRSVCDYAMQGRWPDLAVLLAVSEETAATRVDATPDRMEAAGRVFHRRVADGFAQLAEDAPDQWVVVDAAGSITDVAAKVWAAVAERLTLEDSV
ncbi:MAG: dTMP kinase [Acidimicrobiales bacterium]